MRTLDLTELREERWLSGWGGGWRENAGHHLAGAGEEEYVLLLYDMTGENDSVLFHSKQSTRKHL